MYKLTAIILSVSVLTGCAPLQQAPLAYTSKVAWGLDISSTTTETPGISMVVGYKAVDAAYVPVAVSKKCVAGSECTDKIYALEKLNGQSNETLSDIDTIAEKDSELSIIRNNLEATKTSNNAKIAALRDKIEALNKEKESLDGQDEEKQSNVIQAIAANDLEINKAKNEITAAQAKYDNANAELEIAKKTPNGVANSDAYSVYGRFESKADAEAAKMGFSIGKVFSTGVASQNLTRGLANSYRAIAESRKACYLAAQVAINEKQQQDIINTILDGCKAIN